MSQPKKRSHNLVTLRTTKRVPCVACNGTGVYDTTGSPDCTACNGYGTIAKT